MFVNIIKLSMRTLRPTKVVQVPVRRQPERHSSEWMHRHPAAVVNEDGEVLNVDDEPGVYKKRVQRLRKYRVQELTEELIKKKGMPKLKQKEAPKKKEGLDDVQTLDEYGKPIITLIKDNDVKFGSLMVTVKSRVKREKKDLVLLEGSRLILDAIDAGAVPKILIFSRRSDLEKIPLQAKGTTIYRTSYKTMQLWSNLDTCPGIMGLFRTPDVENIKPAPDSLPLTIICDNVREPGNLGSVFRVAAGIGCNKVILTKGCVSLWDPKVLRSAAGAHFRLPILKSKDWDEIVTLIDPSASVFVADNNTVTQEEDSTDDEITKEAVSASDEPVPVLNETAPASDEAVPVPDETVPVSDEAELKASEENQDIAENSVTEVDQEHFKKKSYKSQRKLLKNLSNSLAVVPYYAVDFTGQEVVLIIGGETEGLSFESFALLRDYEGLRLNIPLKNDVNSLNISVALGIIAFEMNRQIVTKKIPKE